MCYHFWLNCVFMQNYYNLINLVHTPLSRQQSAIKIIFPFYNQEQNVYLKAHNQPEISHDQLFWHDFIVEELYSHKYQGHKNLSYSNQSILQRFFFFFFFFFYCQCIITTYLSDNRNHLMFFVFFYYPNNTDGKHRNNDSRNSRAKLALCKWQRQARRVEQNIPDLSWHPHLCTWRNTFSK